MTVYLNKFRRKPAISKFDWPFTPSHSLSLFFSTNMSSAFPRTFSSTSAYPWLDHLVSGLFCVTFDAFIFELELATQNKLLIHYTKGTPHYILCDCCVNVQFQDLFTFPRKFNFSSFPRGTVYYRLYNMFRVDDGSSFFKWGFIHFTFVP